MALRRRWYDVHLVCACPPRTILVSRDWVVASALERAEPRRCPVCGLPIRVEVREEGQC